MKCERCGEELPEDAGFCRNCGHKLEKESFLKRYRFPLAVVCVVLISAAIAIAAHSALMDMTSQDVQIDTVGFRIPNGFEEDVNASSTDNESGIITASKTWFGPTGAIRITAMHSDEVYIDADLVNSRIGGDEKDMLGYSGYFRKNSDVYSFSFVKDNTLITIYTTDEGLFDEIEVI